LEKRDVLLIKEYPFNYFEQFENRILSSTSYFGAVGPSGHPFLIQEIADA